jgi:hypothetical protein
MRRLIVTTALAAALLPAAAAHASQTAALDVSAELLNQPVGRPWAINLGTSVTVSTPDGGPPSPLKTIDIHFPKATLNDRRFPSCDVDRLERLGPKGCPKGSHIGTGTAQADVRPLLDFPIDVDIDVYNGPRRNGGRILIFDSLARQVSVQLFLQGTLRKVSGRYGYQLKLAIPKISTIPGANDAAISKFDVKVGARRGGRSFLEAPRSCPRSGLPFAGTFGYADGTSSSTTATISCTLRSTRG